MMMMQPVLVNHPRRLSAVASGHAELAVSGLALPPNVIRLPRGPDKGKGFQRWCKTRMQPAPQQSQPSQPAEAQQKPVQRKSRAIPIVAPPAAGAAAAAAPAEEAPAAEAGAVGGAVAAPAAPAAPAPNNNLVVNLESSDSDEGHFSDHDLDVHENERTR